MMNSFPTVNKLASKFTDHEIQKTSYSSNVFFSIETIVNDAKKNKVKFYNHLTHLVIHSFLHIYLALNKYQDLRFS